MPFGLAIMSTCHLETMSVPSVVATALWIAIPEAF